MRIANFYLCGLATDYCVYFSALDARKMGFQVTGLVEACAGVDVPAGNVERAVADMRDRGVRILSGVSFPDFVPPVRSSER
jgi:nicotinamidase/pyrazinamidase